MKKYLVDVYLPAVGKHYDVFLPTGKSIEEAEQLLAGMLENVSNGSYKATLDAMLLDANTGVPFNRSYTVYDAGIRNSSKLILI